MCGRWEDDREPRRVGDRCRLAAASGGESKICSTLPFAVAAPCRVGLLLRRLDRLTGPACGLEAAVAGAGGNRWAGAAAAYRARDRDRDLVSCRVGEWD